MTVVEIISGAPFRYGAFPLISAAAGVFLKCATRNDQYAFFKKEDLAVGPQLILTSIMTFVVVSTDRARSLTLANTAVHEALSSGIVDHAKLAERQGEALVLSERLMGATWLLMSLLAMLWGVTIVVKRWGWKTEAELHTVSGIGLPLALGVASLITVMTAVQP